MALARYCSAVPYPQVTGGTALAHSPCTWGTDKVILSLVCVTLLLVRGHLGHL